MMGHNATQSQIRDKCLEKGIQVCSHIKDRQQLAQHDLRFLSYLRNYVMYINFFYKKNWSYYSLSYDVTDLFMRFDFI